MQKLVAKRLVESVAMRGIRRWVGLLCIVIWLAITGTLVASLSLGHWALLPHPAVGETFPAKPTQRSTQRLHAFHFLYNDCPCSQRVLDRVVNRLPVDGMDERIVLIGGDSVDVEIPSGFKSDHCTPQELKKKYGVEAAPLLVVIRSDGTILYSGGYTHRQRGPNIQDESILRSIVGGDDVEGLPVFGCAVSNELKQLVDPFRLKYSAWSGRE